MTPRRCVAPLKDGRVVIGDLKGVPSSTRLDHVPASRDAVRTGCLISVGGCAADRWGKNVDLSDIFAGNVTKLSLKYMSLGPPHRA